MSMRSKSLAKNVSNTTMMKSSVQKFDTFSTASKNALERIDERPGLKAPGKGDESQAKKHASGDDHGHGHHHNHHDHDHNKLSVEDLIKCMISKKQELDACK